MGLIPSGVRPSRDDIFGSIQVDYKLFLSLLGVMHAFELNPEEYADTKVNAIPA